MWSTGYCCQILTKAVFYGQIFEKKIHHILNLTKIRPVGSDLFHADGQTDMEKLTVSFRDFLQTRQNKKLLTLLTMPESPMGLTLRSNEKVSGIVPYALQISLWCAAYLSSHTFLKKNISIIYNPFAYLIFPLATALEYGHDTYRLAFPGQQFWCHVIVGT